MNGLDNLIKYEQSSENTFCVIGSTFWNFGSSMLFNFVLVWLYKYFDMSVTDESCVDEKRVCLNIL